MRRFRLLAVHVASPSGYHAQVPPTEGKPMPEPIDTIVLDVDGTLVDSTYQHVIAWSRAFEQTGYDVPLWRIHRANGMGGDRLVPHLVGDDAEAEHGDEIRQRWEHEFDALLEEVLPLPGARELLDALAHREIKVVLATSGRPQHTRHALDSLDARGRVDDVTTSADVEDSKPAPDIIHAAIAAVGGSSALVVGDSTWDGEAAQREGARMVGVLTGGFGKEELMNAGAERVFEDLADVADYLAELQATDRTPGDT
jgi:HAD superfamily hydrolase (TIGR01549 family)